MIIPRSEATSRMARMLSQHIPPRPPFDPADGDVYLDDWDSIPEPTPGDLVQTAVFLERSTAAQAADPAGISRIRCVDALDRAGVGPLPSLCSYGWGVLQTWNPHVVDGAHLAGPTRASLAGLTDHTRVDLAKAFREFDGHGNSAWLLVVLGTTAAEVPRVVELGADYREASAELTGIPADSAWYGPHLGYEPRVMFAALDGTPAPETAARCEATGGAAMGARTAPEIAAFAERCASVHAELLAAVTDDCEAGRIKLEEP